jgi:co-chaperonin GroES (HSP10)
MMTREAIKAPPLAPVGRKFLVLQDEAIETTESGLQIPTDARERKRRGTIIKVGNETEGFEVGERIAWLYDIVAKIEWEGVEYLILDIDDVAVILPDRAKVQT